MNTYPCFPLRRQQVLDGIWDFYWAGQTVPLADFVPADARFDGGKAAVPGVFDMGIDHYCERGLGVYRTFVENFDAKRLRLKIGGLGLAARIFWDGKEIGEAMMPYSPVTIDFTSDPKKAKHELVIAVDNRFEAQKYQYFRDFYDFYGFGGIYRGVSVSEMPEPCHIERVQVFTEDRKTGRVRLRILLGGKPEAEMNFFIAFDGMTRKTTCDLPVRDGAAEIELNVPNFKIWSPEKPSLHTVTVAIENDAVVERFGIRTIEAKDHALYLNGKKLFLEGANRHETHPQFGPVQTAQSMLEDIRLFRRAGMNFIRCVHYPQSQEWLDLCDETGMLVWVESLGWGLDEKAVSMETMPGFREQNRLMIREGINHPSVIIWAMLNECASHKEESIPVYKALLEDMKAEDPGRLRSYASCRNVYDVCLAEADVISMNCYPGWFQDITDSSTPASKLIGPHLENVAQFYSQEKFGNKPIIISEIGACAMFGLHDRNLAQWTEEFQADFMREAARAVTENPLFSGYALWQFCDSRSYIRGQIRGKPRGYNLAGLVDEYRRPKMAYDAVADYILSRRRRNGK